MNFIGELILIWLTAAIIENVVFVRGMGQDFHAHYSQTASYILLEGIMVTAFAVLGALTGWFGRVVIQENFTISSTVRPAIYIAIYAVAVFIILFSLQFYAKKTNKQFTIASCMMIYGFIPIATILVTAGQDYNMFQSAIYGLGGGFGYIGASFINRQMQHRLASSDIPVAFRGAPITLITFGILSLALMGLTGNGILI